MNVLKIEDIVERIAADERVKATRAAHEAAGRRAANAECRMVAELIREVLPEAAELTFDKYVDDHDATQVTLLFITGANDKLLWYNQHAMHGHPMVEGNDGLNPHMDLRLQHELRHALIDAYDADAGHFNSSWVENLDVDNPLILSFDEAIAADVDEDRGKLLLGMLAELTGDPILAELDVDELVCAVRTLGEISAAGLDINPHDDLSKRQMEVADNLGGLWATHVAGCGWCGDTTHEEHECQSEAAVKSRNTCEQCGAEEIADQENRIGERCIAHNLGRCS